MKKSNILALALAAGLVMGGSNAYAANVVEDTTPNTNVWEDTTPNTNVQEDTTPNTNVWPDTTPNTNVWPDTDPNPNVKPDTDETPEVKPEDKPEVKPEEKPEVKPEVKEENPVKKNDNPKTGVAGMSTVASLAAVSLAGIVATRKKNN